MTHQDKHASFYSAFEARYRGSRELISSRLEVYRPFIEPLAKVYKSPRAIDLGCGRGEWLELVNRLGYQGVGVDLDEGMLAPCRALSLNVEQGDALEFLKGQKDRSCVVISSLHMVEHIPFNMLQEIVEQSLRVLKSGGLLIMETPNPENLIVSGVNFYLDPTHQKPIPPDLLAFVPEHYGFERVKVLRLNHDPNLAARKDPTLLDVLGGVSPDYAVVARKSGQNRYLEATNSAFDSDVGLTLHTLAEGFEQESNIQRSQLDELKQGFEQAHSVAAETELRAERLAARAEQLEATTASERSRADRAELRLEEFEAKAKQASERADRAEVRLEEFEAKAKQASERADRAEVRLEASESNVRKLSIEIDEIRCRLEETDAHLTEARANADAEAARANHLEAQLAETRAHHAAERHQLSAENKDLQGRLNESLGNAHHWWLTASAYEKTIQALESSWSWRLTWPVRKALDVIRWLLLLPIRLAAAVFGPILRGAMAFVLKRPRLRQFASNILQKLPFVYWPLFRMGEKAGLPVTEQAAVIIPPQPSAAQSQADESESQEQITAAANAADRQTELRVEALSTDEILSRIRAELLQKK